MTCFQIDISSLGLAPVVNYAPQTTSSTIPTPRLGSSSSASFYLTEDIGGMPFFELPPYIKGNNMKSYGGYLSFTLSYNGRYQVTNAPDVIVIGNDYKLFHTVDYQFRPKVGNEAKVRFWVGFWHKNDPQGPLATREEILYTITWYSTVL